VANLQEERLLAQRWGNSRARNDFNAGDSILRTSHYARRPRHCAFAETAAVIHLHNAGWLFEIGRHIRILNPASQFAAFAVTWLA